MKIRTRLRLNLVISIGTPLIVMLLLYSAYSQFNAELLQRHRTGEIRSSISKLNLLLSEFGINPDQRFMQQWSLLQKELEAKLLMTGFDDPEELSARNRLIRLNTELKETSARVLKVAEARPDGPPSALSRDEPTQSLLLQLLAQLQQMRDEGVRISEATERQITESLQRYALVTVLSVGFLALLMALLSILADRRLAPGLRSLQNGIDKIQNGSVDFRLRHESNDELGDLARAFDRMLDIRSAALQALEASEHKYRNLVENLPSKIFVKDSELRYLSCNRAYAQDLGIDEEKIVGKTDFDFYPEELADKYRADDHRVLANGQPIDIEEKYLVAGQETWVQTKKVPLCDSNGRCTGLLGIFWDISERKQAEDQIRRLNQELEDRVEQRYRNYFELGQIGMAMTSPEKGWVEVNDRLCDLLGYSREELMTMTWVQLTHPEDMEKDVACFNRLLTGEKDEYTLEKRFIQKDGKVVHAFISVSCVRLPSGEPDYFVALVQDISQRKRAEERLEKTIADLKRSNQDLEQFAYVASHDLQEPLRMVASYVQLLARRYRGQLDADADDFINYAVTGANRMQMMINDLLAFSRAGRSKESMGPVSCEEVLATTLANLQKIIRESEATITHDPLPGVVGRFPQLTLVFQNLIANALKFHGQEPPKIHIGAQREGRQWVFSVKDNGIGIDPQYFNRLFIIFQRLHGREEYPGSGIGLALAKKIIEYHGGRIWIESQLEEGSTFFFTLTGAEMP